MIFPRKTILGTWRVVETLIVFLIEKMIESSSTVFVEFAKKNNDVWKAKKLMQQCSFISYNIIIFPLFEFSVRVIFMATHNKNWLRLTWSLLWFISVYTHTYVISYIVITSSTFNGKYKHCEAKEIGILISFSGA